jgi:hypothetical protein
LDAHNTPPLDIQGPITRARAQQLNLEVSSLLNSSFYNFENRLLPNDYIVIRNMGEDQGEAREDLGGAQVQQGRPSHQIQVEAESKSTSRQIRIPETGCTKKDAQDAYGLG